MIEYGRRSWVPSACPTCGCTPEPRGQPFSLTLLLRRAYFSYSPVLRKNSWGLDRWFAHCGKCYFREHLGEPRDYLMLSRVQGNYTGEYKLVFPKPIQEK